MRTLETWLLAYLLNSAWQIPLLYAAACLTTRSVRRNGPVRQHHIWVSALVLELLLPACTLSPDQLIAALCRLVPRHIGDSATNVRITVTTGPVYAHGFLHLPALLLTFIVLAYASSILYFATRVLWSYCNTTELRRRSHPIVLSGAAAATWSRCCNLFTVYDAQVAESSAPYPLTIGIRRRLILLPADFYAALATEDLDAALAHEFAHMRRRDFAKNLFYAVLSLPVAYHPLLWLTRTRIEETREMICDAMAAETFAGSHRYAHALLRLASLFANAMPEPTPHAIGIFDANIFERRIMNLTSKPIELRGLRRIVTTAACIALGLATCASALALRTNVSIAPTAAPMQTDQAAQPERVIHIAGGVIAGERLTFVEPVYPPDAKAAKLSGAVVLHAIIGKDGKIESLTVASSTNPVFDSSAIGGVKQWTYKPYLLNGDPTEVDTTITVNYSLNPLNQ